MDFRRLGNSGLVVSVVGLGTNNFGMKLDMDAEPRGRARRARRGHHPVRHRRLLRQVRGAARRDPRGQARRRRPRDQVRQRRRARRGNDNGEDWGARGSRRYIKRAVESSLRRLRTDWIDLYQLHRPDEATPIEETLSALDDLVREGKVRYLGSSNFTGWQVADAEWTARTRGLERFVSAQNEYSWLERDIEADLVPGARAVRHRAAAVLPARQRAAHRQVPPRRGGAGGQPDPGLGPRVGAHRRDLRRAREARGVRRRARRHPARRRDRRAGRAAGGRQRHRRRDLTRAGRGATSPPAPGSRPWPTSRRWTRSPAGLINRREPSESDGSGRDQQRSEVRAPRPAAGRTSSARSARARGCPRACRPASRSRRTAARRPRG